MNRTRTAAAALAAAGILSATAACSGGGQTPGSASAATGTAAAALPSTPPGVQARWLLGAIEHQPIPAAAITAHFDQVFLAKIPPAQLNAVLAHVTSLRLDTILTSTSEFVALAVTDNGQPQTVSVSVDVHGLINGLGLAPAAPPPVFTVPTTWAAVDRQIQQAAPQTRLLVARVTGGGCQTVHAVDATTPAPLGSAFKLYVLDALGSAVASGKVRWNQPLTITAQLKSLPSGELQDQPDGTQISVQDTAAKMISISDNTAANMLINLVGRPAVEAALTTTGMADPALDRPFLTTRELFILKLDQWPALADRYIAANQAGRQALLASTIDRAPLPAVAAAQAWTTPRDINSLEWFASANDICRAYTSLAALARRPGLSPIGQVLSLNDGGLQLDPAQWKTTWFKGGSEPGVLTLTYLATTRTGQSYVVTVLAENPSQPINEATAAPVMLSAIKGAFTLAARR